MAVPRDEGNDLDDLVVTVEPPAKTARVGEGDCVSADPVGSIPSRAISPAQSTPMPSISLEPTVMMSHALSSSLDRALQPQPPALQNDSTAELRESNRIMQHMQQMMFEFMKTMIKIEKIIGAIGIAAEATRLDSTATHAVQSILAQQNGPTGVVLGFDRNGVGAVAALPVANHLVVTQGATPSPAASSTDVFGISELLVDAPIKLLPKEWSSISRRLRGLLTKALTVT